MYLPIPRASARRSPILGTLKALTRFYASFPGLDIAEVPGGEGWAVEQLNLTAHAGTHLDAPWHFASTMNNGERAWTIEEVPLDWCIRPGVKLDLRDLPDGYVATAADLEAAVKATGMTCSPFDIVLINTALRRLWTAGVSRSAGCGIDVRRPTADEQRRPHRRYGCLVLGCARSRHGEALRRNDRMPD